NIEGVTSAGAFARFTPVASAGIERILVRRYVQRVGAWVEGVLRAVSVVHVVVQDGGALGASAFEQPCGGQGDIVEDTEAHRLIRCGMVSRRTDQAHGIVESAIGDGVDRLDKSAGGPQGSLPGTRRNVRISVDVAAARADELAHRLDMARRVHELESRFVGARRLPCVKPIPRLSRVEMLDDCAQSIRPLWVVRASIVPEE